MYYCEWLNLTWLCAVIIPATEIKW